MNRRTFMAAVAAAFATAAVSISGGADAHPEPAKTPTRRSVEDSGDLWVYQLIVQQRARWYEDVIPWSPDGNWLVRSQHSDSWELRLKIRGFQYCSSVVWLTLDRPYITFEHEAGHLFNQLQERLDQHRAGIGEPLVPDAH